MAYYLRAFCEEDLVAEPGVIADALAAANIAPSLKTLDVVELGDEGWSTLRIVFEGDVELELTRIGTNGPDRELFVEELLEFQELVDEAEAESSAKQRIGECLRHAEMVYAIEVPASGGQRALALAQALLRVVTDQCPDALVQADGEGFYDTQARAFVAVG